MYKSQCISKYPRENLFLVIQQSGLVIEMMIQKNLKGLERMEVLITSHMKVFLGNEYDIYKHTV